MEYLKWENFSKVIGKAMIACENSGHSVLDEGMVGVRLITAGEGILPAFYERYGFKKEKEVILMGLEL